MLISVNWLNRLLDPGDLTADEAERILTRMGFPIEEREELPGGDVRLDVEITSNRGDCLCHLGCAREIAAGSGRALQRPPLDRDALDAGSLDVSEITSVENRAPDVCPRFTARVIRGVKVGPSPKWLIDALESVGQRSINNIVDATNYVLLETGNPSHAFDLGRLAGERLIVRFAGSGETLTALDDRAHKLQPSDLVVADAERAVSLAGVIGGVETSVTERTTDVLLEVATWDPVTVRTAARRLRITTDAQHRFERIVDARTIDEASERLASLVLDLAGGAPAAGMVDVGPAASAASDVAPVRLRAKRCRELLGVEIPTSEIRAGLGRLEINCVPEGDDDTLLCAIPPHRAHDVSREIDLVEEAARCHGLEDIPISEKIHIEAAHPQENDRAVRAMGDLLTGVGFFETVTFSFVDRRAAELFQPAETRPVAVDEERRKGAPFLRPSIIPSLLECRRVNKDAGVRVEGGARLFEIGPAFQETGGGATLNFLNLAMILDAPDRQEGLRRMRGVIEAIARAMGGVKVPVELRPTAPACAGESADACAEVLMGSELIGRMGLVSQGAMDAFDLETPLVAAELDVEALIAQHPPRSHVEPLPAFPAIERDLSIVVDEERPWASIERVVGRAKPHRLAGLDFVGVYRGKQVGAGAKSVTMRLRFQDPERTLRHEEVDPQVDSVVAALKSELNAELRG